jgi:hypothetical protein
MKEQRQGISEIVGRIHGHTCIFNPLVTALIFFFFFLERWVLPSDTQARKIGTHFP